MIVALVADNLDRWRCLSEQMTKTGGVAWKDKGGWGRVIAVEDVPKLPLWQTTNEWPELVVALGREGWARFLAAFFYFVGHEIILE